MLTELKGEITKYIVIVRDFNKSLSGTEKVDKSY